MSEKVSRMNIGKILLLSDGEIYDEFSDYESIYKYQSAEHIMKEILCHYAEYARPVSGMFYGKKNLKFMEYIHQSEDAENQCWQNLWHLSLAEKRKHYCWICRAFQPERSSWVKKNFGIWRI